MKERVTHRAILNLQREKDDMLRSALQTQEDHLTTQENELIGKNDVEQKSELEKVGKALAIGAESRIREVGSIPAFLLLFIC